MPLKNRNLATLIGALMLLLAISYGYWNFMYKPLNQQITTERTKLTALSQEVETAKARAAQLNQIQAEMANLQVEVAELEKQLPKTRELPSLIRLLTHRLESYGLSIASFAPQRPVAKGLYDEIVYRLSITANFHSLARFLTAMGKGERLFAARDIGFNGISSTKDSSNTINVSFDLVSFKYRE